MAAKRPREPPPPLWHVDFQFPEPAKRYARDGRDHKGAHPTPLVDLVGDLPGVHLVSTDFYRAHALDRCTLPVQPDPAGEHGALRLDMRRVTVARGARAELGAVTVYRHALCQSHDLAVKLAGLPDDRLCRGAWDRLDLGALEGRLLPLYAPACVRPPRLKPGDTRALKFAPLDPTASAADERHAFALRPALLLAMTDRKMRDKATADVTAVGFIVSPRAFNVMDEHDDERLGVWFGDGVHPGYQGTLYYFLVVRALRVPLMMGAANPMDAALWRWADWQTACPGVPPRTGVSDLTMHGGAIWRAVLRRPIAEVARELREAREAGLLEAKLLSSARVEGKSGKQPLEGLETRKALLIEHALRDGPMAYLLEPDGEPSAQLLAWRVPLPRGQHAGRALYDELCRWTADPLFCDWFGTCV